MLAVAAVAVAAGSSVLLTGGRPARAQTLSAIGNEAPLSFAVSPDYARTHLVATVAVPVGGCAADCTHIWVTRDGGASWHRTGALSGAASRLVIVHGASGGEVLVAEMSDALAESVDDGATWHAVAPTGTPVGTRDGLVVASHGGQDYVLRNDVVRDVTGSGGADVDLSFDVSDAAPALLAAQNPRTGAPVVLQCDASFTCSHTATLVGSDPRTGSDVSLLRSADMAAVGVVYARTDSAVYRSGDGGRSFLPIPLPARQSGAVYTTIPGAALGVASGARTPLYVAMLEMVGSGRSRLTAGGVYVSSDSGATWRAVGSPGPLDGGASSVVVLPDGRLLAGYVNAHGDAGLVCSADGAQWGADCPAAAAACASSCGGASVMTQPASPNATRPAMASTGGADAAPLGASTSGRPASAASLRQRGGDQAHRSLEVILVAAVCALLLGTGLSTVRRGLRRA
jgi:hypothetical protein